MQKPIKLLFFLFFFFFVTSVFSQNNGILIGSVISKSTKKPIELATISIFLGSDTSLIDYRLSKAAGHFRVTNLPMNKKLNVIISAMGFEVFRQNILFSSDSLIKDLGQIPLEFNYVDLDEVLVKSERPPIFVRNDTIEYNASSFKTLPAALLEDLLKKLPGINVDRNGVITINGNIVSKIYVDGKDFFGNNPRVASRNLPANIIDKVQVIADEDEKYLNPNISPTELAQVINLKLKKEIKKGWFGKVSAGGGGNNQYEAGGIINAFRDTLQISALGFSNNLNKSGFNSTDLLTIGGFQRSGFNNLNINNNNLNIDGLSFGGGNSGLLTSSGAGLNINNEINKKTSINYQYFYGNEINLQSSKFQTQQIINSKLINSFSNTENSNRSNSNFFAITLKKRISQFKSISIKPSLSFSNQHSNSDFFRSTEIDQLLANLNNNTDILTKKGIFYNHNFIYNNTRVKKPGRVIRFSNVLTFGNAKSMQYLVGETKILNNNFTDFNQFYDNYLPIFNSKTNFSFVEPIKKTLIFSLATQFDNYTERTNSDVLSKNQQTNLYTLKIDSLSGRNFRTVFKVLNSASFNFNLTKNLMISPGLSWYIISLNNNFNDTLFSEQLKNYVFPSIRIQWNKISASYSARIVEPNQNEILPILNTINPLYYLKGNPNLRPAIFHTMNISAAQRDPRKKLTYNLSLSNQIVKNGIISDRFISESGIQFINPINIEQSWNSNFVAGLTYKTRNKKNFSFLVSGIFRTSFTSSFVSLNNELLTTSGVNFNSTLDLNFNWSDKIEFYPKYTFGSNTNSINTDVKSKLNYSFHRIELGSVLRLIKNFVFESNFDYLLNPNIPSGIVNNNLLFNLSLNYSFLDQNKGVLKFSAFDIFNRNTGIGRVISENYIQSSQVNLVRQYFLISFIYNIRNFGQKNIGGKEGLFKF